MKILLCGDGGNLREGLRAVPCAQAFDVVGEGKDASEVLELALGQHPDLVLMDVSLPGLDGVATTRRLMAALPALKVIALSADSGPPQLNELFAAGALGYVVKRSLAGELPRALEAVLAGSAYVSPHAEHASSPPSRRRRSLPPSAQGSPGRSLSARERQVLQLLADGKSSKEIAALLAIAVTTVETHRRQIMDKVGFRTIAQLTKYAVREGLTSLD